MYNLAWADSVIHSCWSTEMYWVNWDQPLAAWYLDDFPGIPGHAVQDTVRLAKLPITGASRQHSLPYVRRQFWRMIQRHLLPAAPNCSPGGPEPSSSMTQGLCSGFVPRWTHESCVLLLMIVWYSSSVPNNDKHLGSYKMKITCLVNLPTLMPKPDHHFYCRLLQAQSKTSLSLSSSFTLSFAPPTISPSLSICVCFEFTFIDMQRPRYLQVWCVLLFSSSCPLSSPAPPLHV